MTKDIEDDEVKCTIWLKKRDGKYLGCLCKANGEIHRVGQTLLQSYQMLPDVTKLIKLKSIWKLEDAPEKCKIEPAEFYPECGESLMRMQVQENGDYCYVFDEELGEWMYGADENHTLRELVGFITRNSS